ncbi:MAG: thiolase family protein, partial [Gammaproteobacteria bacterium]|nr:thiolase family protein [Gammaproteobacteria bacterium]
MKDIVIAGYARSPFHFAHKGALTKVRPDDLAAHVVRGLVQRTGIDPEQIEDLIVGCAFPEGEQGFNVARLVGLMAGLPISVAGATINRFCGSSMQAIHMAAGSIQMGAGDAFICAGVESMSRVPMSGFNPMPNPALCESMPAAYMSMGETAENVGREYSISREEQEVFAVNSQQKAGAAQSEGRLAEEIIPIEVSGQVIDQDGCLRPTTDLEGLAGLKLAFDQNGTVTAGTSSPLTDGAAATLVCSAEFAAQNGLTPLARVASIAVSGCKPETMGLGPIFSS